MNFSCVSEFNKDFEKLLKVLPQIREPDLAGERGFEPLNDGTKTRCLTAWLLPKITIG